MRANRISKPCYLITAVLLLFMGCSPSRSTYRHYQEGNRRAAREGFLRFVPHQVFGPAARYYLLRMEPPAEASFDSLLVRNRQLVAIDSAWEQLPAKRQRRVNRRWEAGPEQAEAYRLEVQQWALAQVRTRGTVTALDSLLDYLHLPHKDLEPALNTTWRDIIHHNLGTEDYDVATAIIRRHLGWIEPEYYTSSREMGAMLWPMFQDKYTLCALDRFAADHPGTFIGRDCWRAELQPVFCRDSLPELLQFHRSNAWTSLEIALLNQILSNSDTLGLLPADLQHLADLRKRQLLRSAMSYGLADTTAALEGALHYIRGYAPRYSAFRLMEETLQYCTGRGAYASAVRLLREAYPYFPDTLPSGCNSNFDYQRRVKPWINGRIPILERPLDSLVRMPLDALNTPEGDERHPVLRADGHEIFFAGSGRPDNHAGQDIFTSVREGDQWSTPVLITALSGPGDQLPLSITADGRQLLYQDRGKLYTVRRNQEDHWEAPKLLDPYGLALNGRAFFSTDGDYLLLEGAYTAGSALSSPDIDLFVLKREPDGSWGRPAALGADINTDGNEGLPLLLEDNRTLYFTSTGFPGLGKADIFVAYRKGDDWTHWTRPRNLGKEINDAAEQAGFGHVSPDKKRACFSWSLGEKEPADLYWTTLPPD